jgi:Thioredoxin domain
LLYFLLCGILLGHIEDLSYFISWRLNNMVCQIFENNGDAELISAMLDSYLEARGMSATISKYDKNFASAQFAAAHIEATPSLIIDDELVIGGEILDAREILTRIFEVIEDEPNMASSGGGCGSGGCGSGGCGSGCSCG